MQNEHRVKEEEDFKFLKRCRQENCQLNKNKVESLYSKKERTKAFKILEIRKTEKYVDKKYKN